MRSKTILRLQMLCAVICVAAGCSTAAKSNQPAAGISGGVAGMIGQPAAGISGVTAGTTAGTGLAGSAGVVGAAGAAAAGVSGGTTGGTAGVSAGSAGMAGAAGAGGAGGTAGTGSMVGPDPTADSLAKDGPYKAMMYTSGLATSTKYKAATVYYPSDGVAPFGLVALSPGYTETQKDTDWLPPRLASHGFAVITLDTNSGSDQPPARADALMAALDTLAAENIRQGGPLSGKLDTSKKAIMGHSMGGGGTLIAAQAHSDLKAAIPLAPWEPNMSFKTITVPTLIVAGQNDNIAAVSSNAYFHYMSIPDTTHKVYMEVKGDGHGVANSTGSISGAAMHPDVVSRYIISWLKLYMDGDNRYSQFISGAPHAADANFFSKFETKP